jgi:hypothetical protein
MRTCKHVRLATARTIDRSVILVATLGLAGRQYDLPSRSFWQPFAADHPYTLVVLIAVLGIFGTLTPAEALSRRTRLERAVAMRGQILITFGQLLEIGATVQPRIEVSDLGLHIWRLQRTLRHPWSGELVRLATYRLGSTPQTRTFRPTKGVGVVGLCWERDSEIGFNVEALARRLTNKATFDAYRRDHGPSSVMGFSWEEFDRFRHRGAVFACPVRNGRSNFIGCISFDAAHGYTDLDQLRIWQQLNTLCIVVGQDGFENV